uniref:Uncharacterized protein n=1 Tax=Setaria italica TaxID=4555 RepID=K4A455_SETIT
MNSAAPDPAAVAARCHGQGPGGTRQAHDVRSPAGAAASSHPRRCGSGCPEPRRAP